MPTYIEEREQLNRWQAYIWKAQLRKTTTGRFAKIHHTGVRKD